MSDNPYESPKSRSDQRRRASAFGLGFDRILIVIVFGSILLSMIAAVIVAAISAHSQAVEFVK